MRLPSPRVGRWPLALTSAALTMLAACADEIGMSRIYGGIHFSFDNSEGKQTGQLIADYVTANYLLPNDSLPLLRVEGVTDGGPQLRVHGQVGQTVVLEASADLKTWEAISTNSAAIGGVLMEPRRC